MTGPLCRPLRSSFSHNFFLPPKLLFTMFHRLVHPFRTFPSAGRTSHSPVGLSLNATLEKLPALLLIAYPFCWNNYFPSACPSPFCKPLYVVACSLVVQVPHLGNSHLITLATKAVKIDLHCYRVIKTILRTKGKGF